MEEPSPPATESFDDGDTVVTAVEIVDAYTVRFVFNQEATDISGVEAFHFEFEDDGAPGEYLIGATLQIYEGDFHKLVVQYETPIRLGGSWRILEQPGVIFGAHPAMTVPESGSTD